MDAFKKWFEPLTPTFRDYFITINALSAYARLLETALKETRKQPDRESAGKFYYSHFHQFTVEPVILQIFFVGQPGVFIFIVVNLISIVKCYFASRIIRTEQSTRSSRYNLPLHVLLDPIKFHQRDSSTVLTFNLTMKYHRTYQPRIILCKSLNVEFSIKFCRIYFCYTDRSVVLLFNGSISQSENLSMCFSLSFLLRLADRKGGTYAIEMSWLGYRLWIFHAPFFLPGLWENLIPYRSLSIKEHTATYKRLLVLCFNLIPNSRDYIILVKASMIAIPCELISQINRLYRVVWNF